MTSDIHDVSFKRKIQDLYLTDKIGEEECEGGFSTNLLSHFKLSETYSKMSKLDLPDKYTHLVPELSSRFTCVSTTGRKKKKRTEIEEEEENKDYVGLMALVNTTAFDRPIETFPEEQLRTAFALNPSSKLESGLLLSTFLPSKSGIIRASPSISVDNLKQGGSKMDAKTNSTNPADAKAEKERRKEKKKKKREKEEALDVKKVLKPFITELSSKTFPGWIIKGKPSNPFLSKITRENCAKLGVPNYFDFVKEAMDMTTMKEKVESMAYNSLDQFGADMKLLVENAKTFNRAGEPVHQMAIDMMNFYNSRSQVYKLAIEQKATERKKKRKEKKKKKDKKKTQ